MSVILELKFKKVILSTDLRNLRAQHVYEQLGFKKVKVFYDSWTDQLGKLRTSVCYELEKKDFISYIKENIKMKMLIKQRFFSWFESYDVYDENDEVLYVCKGQFSWGHTLKVLDQNERELGMIKEKVWSFLPKFEVYKNDILIGTIAKEFTLFKPKFNIDYNSWKVEV